MFEYPKLNHLIQNYKTKSIIIAVQKHNETIRKGIVQDKFMWIITLTKQLENLKDEYIK